MTIHFVSGKSYEVSAELYETLKEVLITEHHNEGLIVVRKKMEILFAFNMKNITHITK